MAILIDITTHKGLTPWIILEDSQIGIVGTDHRNMVQIGLFSQDCITSGINFFEFCISSQSREVSDLVVIDVQVNKVV